MDWWQLLLAYLGAGFLITMIVGFFGMFDYHPREGQFRPGTFKYMTLLFWPVFVLMTILGILFYFGPKWLNEKFNNLVGVRVDKR